MRPPDPDIARTLERLVVEHSWLIDHGRAAEATELYHADARALGTGPDKVGHEAIRAWLSGRQAMTQRRSRHVVSNLRLEETGPGQVRGWAVLTLLRHDGDGAGGAAPLLVGEYEDLFTRDSAGSWRFAERRLVVLFGAG